MNLNKIKICTLFLLLSILFTFGCTNPFHPEATENVDNGDFYPFDNPKNVLLNLQLSYQQQNLELYEKCLSDSFRFELISSDVSQFGVDMNGDGINDSWWGYQQEISYHRNLFIDGSSDGNLKTPDQISLNLQIPPEESWQIDNQEGHEGWIIIPCHFDLQLFLTNASNILSNGYALFYLKEEAGEWKIAVWRDESNVN